MTIKEEELKELGFIEETNGFYYSEHWEYQFNPHNNELLYFNEGFGDDEPLVTIKDLNHFKQVIKALNI